MKVLEYNDLVTTQVAKSYQKVLEALARDDFYTAEVKKLVGTPFYRAKLDYKNRLLFQIVRYQGEPYALILEVIYQHDYANSRFLNGAKVREENIKTPNETLSAAMSIQYLNSTHKSFNILNKIVSFDETQADIFAMSLPLILIGSAGSGKTTLTLEKMKHCTGDILYVTHSPYLVEHSRTLYYGQYYRNEQQNIDFLSFKELLETIKIPKGQPLDYAQFKPWFARHQQALKLDQAYQVFEEFRGVLTGSEVSTAYLSQSDYLNLGIRQTIFNDQERPRVYNAFQRYLSYLKESGYYDPNLLAYEYMRILQAKYDCIVLDEVQDFTNIQIQLLLKLCRHPEQFIFCGDANQIVHPNFFSWAKVKTLLFQALEESRHSLLQILHTNYRNAQKVTEIANRILKVKQQRFGSIDKESNYLMTPQSEQAGEIYCVLPQENALAAINQLSKLSTQFAILVMKEEDKPRVKKIFQSPLIFSIHEAKGLEYQNIVLVDFISNEAAIFSQICEGMSAEALNKEHVYARAKHKNDKSLEAYKFYINALYVAITRSVQNLYVIESNSQHPFLKLLGLRSFQADLSAQKAEASSLQDWQKEAHKLEMQGKLEQAAAIRTEILKQKTPPWQVLTQDDINTLFEKAQQGSSLDKAQKLQLLEYALIYEEEAIVHYLQKLNFHPAQNLKRAREFIQNKYYLDYTFKNTNKVLRQVSDYGVDFRNPFNETPLMLAAKVGNEALVATLLELGADPDLINNRSLNALQIILQASPHKLAPAKVSLLYQSLSTKSLSIEVAGQLIKIDAHKIEFFLFNLLIGLFAQHGRLALAKQQSLFLTAVDLTTLVKHFDTRILAEYRKKRPYLSSILSKNEMFRNGPYNHRLFLRLRVGCYIINPRLKVKKAGQWINFYQLIGIPFASFYPGIEEALLQLD